MHPSRTGTHHFRPLAGGLLALAALSSLALSCADSGEAPAPLHHRRAALAVGLPDGVVSALTERQGFLLPTLPRSALSRPRATVLLPADASLPFRVADPVSDLSVHVRLLGASPSPARLERGHVAYPGALGPSTSVLHRVLDHGTEDFVFFEHKPSTEELRYEVDVRRAAGLRMVPGSRALELLDEAGAPRVRVRPPWGVDAEGKAFEAELEVRGCEVETSAAGPWGKGVKRPGAERCEVVVRWSGVSYPAAIDPAWETTLDMITPRALHTATLLADGRVLVFGGAVSGNLDALTAKAELYDPATGTWAATGPISQPLYDLQAVRLDDGRVFFAHGGQKGGTPGTLEVYDPTTGQFTSLNRSSPARWTGRRTPCLPTATCCWSEATASGASSG